MEDLFEQTKERTAELETEGLTVVEMWECKWVKTAACRKIMKTLEFVAPLDPREALFGGRTEVFKLFAENSDIGYGDVVSLYPTVMYHDYYPIGHPTKFFQPQAFDANWFGFITCKVIAPQNLYLPVLPVRVKMGPAEKLLFPLCVKCAETQSPNCEHSMEERQFRGTWTTEEVKKALEKGYQITYIDEVWHFEKTNELWKGYISDFMKMKLETSPHNYPSNEAYGNEFREKMGIDINPKDVAPKASFVENNFNTNIYVAAYTTANARLRLYSQLERMDRQTVYCDTDSIMYNRNGGVELPFGEMLGEWTDELNGGRITKWVATGPKAYYYETDTGKVSTKVKGFTLHHNNAQKINGEAMEALIKNEIPQIVVRNNEITRNRGTKQLVNKDQTKTFSFGFDKRVIVDDYDTVPYGYMADTNANLDILV